MHATGRLMRILHVMPDLSTGGAELMMKRLIESHIGDPGYEHRVISLRGLGTVGPQLQAQGIEVETLGLTSPVRLPATLLRLTRSIRAARPDVVQTWMYHADLLGGLAARRAGCRRILWGVRIADISARWGVSRHTSLVRRACALLSRRVPSRIVYVAESARRIHEGLGYDPAKSIVIPNGYRIPEFSEADRQAFRAELGLGARHLVVASAGRFNLQKDYRTFVRACAMVADAVPEARFVVAGRDVARSNPELAGWIADSGRGDRFHLLGERRDLQAVLADADVFCLHSLQEGFPNVVAEAMSVAVPCVVTDVGDAAALVEGTGSVVPPADPPALAGALIAMLRKAPAEREALGAAARARIAERFSMDSIRARYEALYRSLAEDSPASAGTPASAGPDRPAPQQK